MSSNIPELSHLFFIYTRHPFFSFSSLSHPNFPCLSVLFPSCSSHNPVFNQCSEPQPWPKIEIFCVFQRGQEGEVEMGDRKESQKYGFISISPVNQTLCLYWVTSWTKRQQKKRKQERTWQRAGLPNSYNRWFTALVSLEPGYFTFFFLSFNPS